MQRRTRRIIYLGMLLSACALCVWGLWYFVWRGSAETDRFTIAWRSTGKGGVVEGTVVDHQGRPVAGTGVHIDNDSGGQDAATDANGHFEIQPGESEVTGLEVAGGKIEWGGLGVGLRQLHCSRGLEFRIVLKPNK